MISRAVLEICRIDSEGIWVWEKHFVGLWCSKLPKERLLSLCMKVTRDSLWDENVSCVMSFKATGLFVVVGLRSLFLWVFRIENSLTMQPNLFYNKNGVCSFHFAYIFNSLFSCHFHIQIDIRYHCPFYKWAPQPLFSVELRLYLSHQWGIIYFQPFLFLHTWVHGPLDQNNHISYVQTLSSRMCENIQTSIWE